MARSRLVKIGTIHSRTTGLLRAGAMKEEDKPLWFDIYEAFPPKDEPRFDRPESNIPIREIFYKEDVIRAKYHKDHPHLPLINLNNTKYETQTQKFIAAYQQLQRDGIDESELYEKALLQTPSRSSGERWEETEQWRGGTVLTEEGQKAENRGINLSDIFKET